METSKTTMSHLQKNCISCGIQLDPQLDNMESDICSECQMEEDASSFYRVREKPTIKKLKNVDHY
jgi:hypothetical protein